MINVSYGLEVEYGENELMEVEHIEFKYVVNGIMNIPELKGVEYTGIYLVTIIKDANNNLLKKSQCRIL